jgi:hypothetical protein
MVKISSIKDAKAASACGGVMVEFCVGPIFNFFQNSKISFANFIFFIFLRDP